MDQTFSLDWARLWRCRLPIAISFGAAFLLVAALYATAPKQWQAVGLVQVGSVTPAGNNGGDGTTDVPLIAPAAAIVQMRAPSFIERAAAAAGDPAAAMQLLPPEYGGSGALQLLPITATNVIAIRVVANQPQKAKRLTQAIADELIRHDKRLLQPWRTMARARVNALQQALSTLPPPDSPSAGAERDFTAARLRSDLARAEESLTFPALRETELIEPISVIAQPVSPRPLVYAAGGLLLGFALSLLVVAISRRRL